MSDDLIARLRHMSFETWDDQPNESEVIVQRAADEIERLRAQVAKYDEERTQISPQGAARAADGGAE